MMGIPLRSSIAVLLLAAIPSISAAEEAPSDIDPSLLMQQFDVFNDGDALLVPVQVFGKTRFFVVDTGSPGTFYDTRLRPLLGEPKRKLAFAGLNAPTEIELFDPPKALLGSLKLGTSSFVACNDFSQIRQWSGHEIEGIVGMAFLRHFVIQIDFDSGKLAFLSASPQNPGVALPIRWLNEIMPAVEVEIAGHGNEEFVIDTGMVSSCMASIAPRLLKDLQEKGSAKALHATPSVDLSGKTRDVDLCVVDKMAVAGFDFNDALVAGHQLHKANFLGLGFLSRFVITMDFPKGVIYLKKSRRYGAPIQEDLAGIEIVRRDGAVVVHSIDPNSAASRAGIKPNDVLLRIGDDKAAGLRLLEVRNRFSSPGGKLRLDLRRGKETLSTDIVLSGSRGG